MCVSKHLEVIRDILPLTPLAPYVATVQKWASQTSCLSLCCFMRFRGSVLKFGYGPSKTVYNPEEALIPLHARRVLSSPL